jgi:hypothetical protein
MRDLDDVISDKTRELVRTIEDARAQALADVLLRVLRERGLEVDAATEARMRACRDQEQLQGWVVRAAQVARAPDLFEGSG